MSQHNVRSWFLAVACTSLVACGSDPAPKCISGATQPCTCAGGASGAQTCTASGSFGTCDCGDPIDLGGIDSGGRDGGGVDGGGLDAGPEDGGPMTGTGETVSAMIGTEGGTVTLTSATLTIPAGSVTTPTMITVTETTLPTPPGYRPFSPLYHFEPDGLTFTTPPTISIRSNASGADVPLGTLFWSRPDSAGGGWERRGGVPTGGNVVGTAPHFSYGFLADGVDYTETPNLSCVRTRVLENKRLDPSGIGVFFALDDCWGRTITDLDNTTAVVYEDDVPLSSSEAGAQLYPQRGLQIFVTLAIDVSASTRPIQAQVIAAARRFVETLNDPARGLRDRVQVSILGFAGEAAAGFRQPHTLDLDLVLARLDELAAYVPADASSTNLNGVVVEALNSNAAAEAAFRARNQGGAFAAGYVALFTDGADTSGRVTAAAANTAILASTDDVVAVGLRGTDYAPAAIRQLFATAADPTGDLAPLFSSDDTTVLDRDFAYLAARIAGQVRRTYLVGYCSPKRSGTHTVYVGHRSAPAPTVWGAAPTFSAAGFAGGCTVDMFAPATVCPGTDVCGGFGCGACDDRVAMCDATAGLPATAVRQCVSHCLSENHCSGETVTNRLGYEQTCPASAEVLLCSGRCASVATDVMNCGTCGMRCPAGITCTGGECDCPVATPAVCGGVCRLASFLTTTSNCGACGNACAPLAACANTAGTYACACPAGYEGTGVGTPGCTEIDECVLNTDDCDDDPDACVNTPGSFYCVCPRGSRGTGRGTSGCILHFTNLLDGTIQDNWSGLVWQMDISPTTLRQAGAVAYCSSLTLPGSGWRLPTKDELVALSDGRFTPYNIDLSFLPGSTMRFWSSTLAGGSPPTAFTFAYDPGLGLLPVDMTILGPKARCVR